MKSTLRVDGSAVVDLLREELHVGALIRALAGALFTVVGNTAFVMLVVVYLMLEHVAHDEDSLRGKIDLQIQRYIV